MKSPSYTAQKKLRGKKEKLLSCGCCVILNFKDEVLWKEAAKDMKSVSSEAERLPYKQ